MERAATLPEFPLIKERNLLLRAEGGERASERAASSSTSAAWSASSGFLWKLEASSVFSVVGAQMAAAGVGPREQTSMKYYELPLRAAETAVINRRSYFQATLVRFTQPLVWSGLGWASSVVRWGGVGDLVTGRYHKYTAAGWTCELQLALFCPTPFKSTPQCPTALWPCECVLEMSAPSFSHNPPLSRSLTNRTDSRKDDC